MTTTEDAYMEILEKICILKLLNLWSHELRDKWQNRSVFIIPQLFLVTCMVQIDMGSIINKLGLLGVSLRLLHTTSCKGWWILVPHPISIAILLFAFHSGTKIEHSDILIFWLKKKFVANLDGNFNNLKACDSLMLQITALLTRRLLRQLRRNHLVLISCANWLI